MSIVILGGNECMERRYRDICAEYSCTSRVFVKPTGTLRHKIGSPDLMIIFTDMISHKAMQNALIEVRGTKTAVEHVRSGSASALRRVLDKYIA